MERLEGDSAIISLAAEEGITPGAYIVRRIKLAQHFHRSRIDTSHSYVVIGINSEGLKVYGSKAHIEEAKELLDHQEEINRGLVAARTGTVPTEYRITSMNGDILY